MRVVGCCRLRVVACLPMKYSGRCLRPYGGPREGGCFLCARYLCIHFGFHALVQGIYITLHMGRGCRFGFGVGGRRDKDSPDGHPHAPREAGCARLRVVPCGSFRRSFP